MKQQFGSKKISRSLWHFILGKFTSGPLGIVATLLIVRELSVESFAEYSVLIALVEMLTALSGLGLTHALLRYVPQLYTQHYRASLKHFIFTALKLRTGVLLLASLIAYLFSDRLTPLIGLEHALDAFQAFLVVVILRSTVQCMSQILESTLSQGNVQSAFSLASLVRLTGMLALMYYGEVHLIHVIWIEALGELLSMLIMLYGIIKVCSASGSDARNPDDDGYWLRTNLKQVAKFALSGYLQHLAITPYGGDMNRLVGGGMLNAASMASFGFSQSLIEYIRRYMPAQLLVGLIRPVVVARYCEKGDFSVAAKLCGLVLQVNIIMMGGLLTMLLVGGGDALAAISKAKYAADALPVLAMLMVALLLETQRQQLELLAQTVERYHYLIASNILLSSSIALAVAFVPVYGAIAFPAANTMGLVFANFMVQRRLKSNHFNFRHDWFASLRVLLICAGTLLAGEEMKKYGFSWYQALLASTFLYGLMTLLFCRATLVEFINDFLGREKAVKRKKS